MTSAFAIVRSARCVGVFGIVGRQLAGSWVVMVLALLAAGPGRAVDLLAAFELAKANDPVYRAATFERLAEDSSLRIAWSSLLPNASAEKKTIDRVEG